MSPIFEVPPRVLLIVSSTRPTRIGGQIATWVHNELVEKGSVRVDVADLAEIALPHLDEPHFARDQNYVHAHTRRWSDLVGRHDAFVVVLPEYNAGMPGSLKNAFDYLQREWRHKPIGFVAYSGGLSGGESALAMTTQVARSLQMRPIAEAVQIPRIADHLTDGVFNPPAFASAELDELIKALPDSLDAAELRAAA